MLKYRIHCGFFETHWHSPSSRYCCYRNCAAGSKPI